MSYFNHAFRKTLVATNGISPLDTGTVLGVNGVSLPAGQLAFINPNNWQIQEPNPNLPAPLDESCCELILASGSLMANDRIGPAHGGYLESNKTKTIKAKYASKLYVVPANSAQNYITHVGTTPWTVAVPPVTGNPGETAGDCCKQFLCGETYYLRVDVKGYPVMQTLNHNGYQTLEAYTGCCADDAVVPAPVDPRRVFIQWGQQLRRNKLLNQFAFPVITFRIGAGAWTYYYPDDIAVLPVIAGVTVLRYRDWVEQAYVTGMCAGMVLIGAYTENRFENCTFQLTDNYTLEPVRIYASEVDLTGSPCEFNGLCVGVQCYGRQANGIGETVVRDVILSESYRQNFFHSDLRIREITQGNDLLDGAGLVRNNFYDRIFIQHSVPRFYNPTGTFDNDQYLVEIITPAAAGAPGTPSAITTTIFNVLQNWLIACESRCVVDAGPFLGVACAASTPAVPLPNNPDPIITLF
jgi:hypothetical protein